MMNARLHFANAKTNRLSYKSALLNKKKKTYQTSLSPLTPHTSIKQHPTLHTSSTTHPPSGAARHLPVAPHLSSSVASLRCRRSQGPTPILIHRRSPTSPLAIAPAAAASSKDPPSQRATHTHRRSEQPILTVAANNPSPPSKHSRIANRVCILCEVEKRHWVADLYLFWFGAEEEHGKIAC
ncbi:hypothetical protein RIF29_21559 [Crotalaria pallida]|uniref:Uncharacterized protein n=1 Tax=Crotalaria pallida TaxID=3830 RepID=A0AAN9F5I9_CROPI